MTISIRQFSQPGSTAVIVGSGTSRGETPFLGRSHAAGPIGGALKRGADITIVLLALPLVLPIFVLVALWIMISDPGPIFFRHRRVGFGGREFDCLKFRTMVVDGDRVLNEHLAANPAAAAMWADQRKLPEDPRVTRLGNLLRRSSLDELPQLLNVLKGDMSLVGPRPVVDEELERYGRSRRYYLSARPGITGLWQVSGRSNTSYQRRVAFDRYYASHWRAFHDLWIIMVTVPAVLSSRGAH